MKRKIFNLFVVLSILLTQVFTVIGVAPAYAAADKVYIVGGNSVVISVNPDGTVASNLGVLGSLSNSRSMVVDGTHGKIYVADLGGPKVVQFGLDGSSPTTLSGLTSFIAAGHPTSMALDLVNSKLYIVDATHNTIIKSDLDGLNASTFTLSGSLPATPYYYGIAVDQINGFLYVTDTVNHTIYKSNLDGTSAVDLDLSASISQPYDVRLDVAGNKMYIMDRGLGAVIRANLDGTSPTNLGNLGGAIAAGNDPRAIAIDVANGYMFAATSGNSSVAKANLNGTSPQNFGSLGGVQWNIDAEFPTYAPASAAPTVSTDSIETLQNRQVNATLSNLGSPVSVSARGVAYNTSGTPTTSDSVVDIGPTIATGAYTVELDGMSLTPGTKYYVRAFATNATGTSYGDELVVYGTPGDFTTIAPVHNATDVSTSPTLSWNASDGATDYEYCYALDVMADCAADMTGPNWLSTTATSVDLSGLDSGTTYGWAVRAVVGTPPSYKWATGVPFTFTTTSAYTVTYDGNGADGGSAPVDSSSPYAPSSTVTVLDKDTLTRTGYAFSRWNTASDNSGSMYNPGQTFTITENTTLYAIWKINKYSVTYDGNGANSGSAPVDSSSPYVYNSTVTVLGNTGALAKTGYAFAGWNTASDGLGDAYAADDTFILGTADVTLYAQWMINQYSITFDSAGGSAVDTITQNYGSDVTKPADPTLEGYTFGGWFTDDSTFLNAYTFSTMPVDGVTLYAKWTVNQHTISFNANGGTGTMSDQSADDNTTAALNANTFTRPNYTFTGWNTAADGNGTAYAGGADYTFTMNETLYAQWTAIVYTASFKSAGAHDGWILESAETSNTGGTLNRDSAVFVLGDGAGNKQYRSVLSFNTNPLAPNAVIKSATLKISRLATNYLIGNNDPFLWGQGLKADVCSGYFGAAIGLQLDDFKYTDATNCKIPAANFSGTQTSGWYSANVMFGALSKINKAGWTQFRLRFTLDDNGDGQADYMRFRSGDAAVGYPKLIVRYTLP